MRLLLLALGITTGVVIALSLVYRREPTYATAYLEDPDGVAPFDPYVVAISAGRFRDITGPLPPCPDVTLINPWDGRAWA